MNSNFNILIYSEKETQTYEKILRDAGFSSIKTASSEEQAVDRLSGTEIIFCWKFPTHLLSLPEAKSVKWIQSMGAGVDDFVSDKNIPEDILLTRVVDQFGSKISEYVFAYLLYIHQNIEQLRSAQMKKRWDPLIPSFISEKTIGVAGLGSIGTEIIRKSRAFDMNVYGLSHSGKNSHLVDKHFFSTDWLSFVKNLDILVLTLPLTNETRRIISKEVLENMNKKAWLINVGRGELILESSLVSALQSKQLGGAILDVFENEPLPKENSLWSLSNVYITPHIAGPSIAKEVGIFFLNNLKQYIDSKPLKGVVSRNKGF